MGLLAETTTFTLDNMGRFLCNTLQEATDSAAVTVAGRPRGFDVIVIGGGTFGAVMASIVDHIQNSWTEMGGKQIVVFLIHRQVVEALSLWSRKIDRRNLLQGLGLQGTGEGQNREQTPKKRPSAQQFHGVTLPSPGEAR